MCVIYTDRLKIIGWEKTDHENGKYEKSKSYNNIWIDLKIKSKSKDKEEKFIIKELIHVEDVTVINAYEHHNRPSKYINQKFTELKGDK